MSKAQQIGDIGYCGLLCSVCSHTREGCSGCRSGGGDEHCRQRECCRENERAGCWECESFPCGAGYFADGPWHGLCTAFVTVIREVGPEAFVELVKRRFGEPVDYGGYRFRDAEELRRELIEGPAVRDQEPA